MQDKQKLNLILKYNRQRITAISFWHSTSLEIKPIFYHYTLYIVILNIPRTMLMLQTLNSNPKRNPYINTKYVYHTLASILYKSLLASKWIPKYLYWSFPWITFPCTSQFCSSGIPLNTNIAHFFSLNITPESPSIYSTSLCDSPKITIP